ncbi:hypothetical protein L564_1785 [Bordetella pertussis CHLA-15]|nr:hypothetical protein L564_1785 [Bordetella pertussis CHLA-15]
MLLGHLRHGAVGLAHQALEPLVDLLLAPEEAGEVLHPLEVADRHAAGVGQHVGHHVDAVLAQDIVGFRGGRAVGALDHDLGAHPGGVVFVDLSLKSGGDQEIGLQSPEIVVGQLLRAGEAGHAALVADVRQQLVHVQPAVVVDGAGVVLHRDHLGAGLMEQARRGAADVAETLHHDAGLGYVEVQVARRLAADHEDAAAGGLDPAQAAAQRDRLAGHHAGGGGAFVHGVRVHHPGHGLGVGVHVRGRDVLGRPDDDADLRGVAARHALELGVRQRARVDPHAALGAAVRQVDGGILDRHPGRQRHHFRQGHVLVETHAALARAARRIVLDAVALEVGDAAVVHFDRHVHDQRALGTLERLDPAGQRTQVRRDAVDLLQVDPPGAQMLGIQV